MSEQPIYTVSDFVAISNQILDMSFGVVRISGEISQFKVSKGRWVYFNLTDNLSSVRFFGTIYQLPGPIEDGMMVIVQGSPQLHPKFGFNVTIQSISLKGEGTIKKSAKLLEDQLVKEGLFSLERKRSLPYPPLRIGLVTSAESAAYADFTKILAQRWGGLDIQLFDVQVQGERAPLEIVEAMTYFGAQSDPVDVLVLIRGGGSSEDLQAFNTEPVTRAVAASRIPTLVAIGHEIDISLAERAADMMASTPSHAAELLVPDKKEQQIRVVNGAKKELLRLTQNYLSELRAEVSMQKKELNRLVMSDLENNQTKVTHQIRLLDLLSPQAVLKRGYAVVRQNKAIIHSVTQLTVDKEFTIQFHDGEILLDK